MKTIIFSIILIITWFAVKSQSLTPEVITTSGDYYTNSYASLSVTIGEIVTETVSNSGNILTQGFQQSTYYVTNIMENKINSFAVTVFPNPTNDLLNIDFKTENEVYTTIQLCDENGKILINETLQVKESKKIYDLKIYSSGLYFLKITTDNNYTKTVKIIKR